MGARAVLLCGGKGIRLDDTTIPKPLVTIGGKPIIWHIMKWYDRSGFRDFLLCTGYKSEEFEKFFRAYSSQSSHIEFDLQTGRERVLHHQPKENWRVVCADTGLETLTGGRVWQVRDYLRDHPYFLCTYGDGVTDAAIEKIIAMHERLKPLVTLMGAHPYSRFGELQVGTDGLATEYRQKPQLRGASINCGFMVLAKQFLEYLSPECMIEDPFPELVKEGKIAVYEHDGFWQCMDTRQERDKLEELWSKNPPWKVWNDRP